MPDEHKCYRVMYDNRGRTRFTVRQDPDYHGFCIADDGENIRIAMGKEVTIPSSGGPDGIQDLFGTLLTIWGNAYPEVEPDLLYIDFGDDKAEGFAAVKLSEQGWAALNIIGFEETTVEALEDKPLSIIDQAKHDRDLFRAETQRLQEENQRLRHTLGMPLDLRTENYDWGEARVRELARPRILSGDAHELRLALNDALKEVDFGRRRFQGERGRLQAVADILGTDVYGVTDALNAVLVELGQLRGKTDIPALMADIGPKLAAMAEGDGEEVAPPWAPGTAQEFFAKIEAARKPWTDGRPEVPRLRENLAFTLQDLRGGSPGHHLTPSAHEGLQRDVAQLWSLYDAAVELTWPSLIPPKHLCLWLRERAGRDAIIHMWAGEIEHQFSGTGAWNT